MRKTTTTNKLEIRTCAYCGVEITKYASHRRYCSSACRLRAWRKRKRGGCDVPLPSVSVYNLKEIEHGWTWSTVIRPSGGIEVAYDGKAIDQNLYTNQSGEWVLVDNAYRGNRAKRDAAYSRAYYEGRRRLRDIQRTRERAFATPDPCNAKPRRHSFMNTHRATCNRFIC